MKEVSDKESASLSYRLLSMLRAQNPQKSSQSLVLSVPLHIRKNLLGILGRMLLFVIAAAATLAVLFIFYFITRDAWPFFKSRGVVEFFTETAWYPSRDPARFARGLFLSAAL